jgi:stringent starvation protein B
VTPTKPYFVRAVYDWIVDNNCTPHVLVDVRDKRCSVPQQFVKNGVIVLNVAPGAVRSLQLGNEIVTFGARFGGVPYEISFPISSVRAIYARENGQGLAFDDEEAASTHAAPEADTRSAADEAAPVRRAPHLTVVK